jgi:hypothetical protein
VTANHRGGLDPSATLSVALAYYHAWTSKDVDRAMTYVADDIVCEAPTGRIEGVEGFRQLRAPFAQMLISSGVVNGSDGGHDGQAEAVALAVAGAVGAESLEGRRSRSISEGAPRSPTVMVGERRDDRVLSHRAGIKKRPAVRPQVPAGPRPAAGPGVPALQGAGGGDAGDRLSTPRLA